MRARNREISIFSMSTLDVIFGALGAFTILMLSVLSKYNPDQESYSKSEYDKAKTGQQMAIAIAQWDGDWDVDLWVDANGQMNGPKPETVSGDVNERKWTDATSAGKEDIAISSASGDYVVYLRLTSAKGHPCPCIARTWFVSTSSEGTYGVQNLGAIPLATEGEMVEVARITMDDDGDVESAKYTYWETGPGSGS